MKYAKAKRCMPGALAALTMILDSCTLLVSCVKGANLYQAQLTFAMARHAAVDLVLVTQSAPRSPDNDRLPAADLSRLHEWLRAAGFGTRDESTMAKALAELRNVYEPFVNTLAEQFHFALPPFVVEKPPVDNWQTSPGMQRSPGLSDLQANSAHEEHDR